MSSDPNRTPTQPPSATLITGIADVYHGDADAIIARGLTLRDVIRTAKADQTGPLEYLIPKWTEGGKLVGTPYTDPRAMAWIEAAVAESVPYGLYHFCTGTDTGVRQAKWCAESMRAHGIDPAKVAFLGVDYEHNPDGATATPRHVSDFCAAWLDLGGDVPWIYANAHDYAVLIAHAPELKPYRWWAAGYGNTRPAHCDLWQYMGAECSEPWEFPRDSVMYPRAFAGLGKVDRSAYAGTREQMLAALGTVGA